MFTQNNTSAADANNTAVGYVAGYSMTTGANNTLMGVSAGAAVTTGINNTALGAFALLANTTGQNNTALGYGSLDANTTAANNTAVGYDSLTLNTTGAQNTGIGVQALRGNTTANSNVAVGMNSMYANTTGPENTAVGQGSLQSNTTGGTNVAVGREALKDNTTASNNTAVGYRAGLSVTTGTRNTIIGGLAGDAVTTGSGNVIVGESSGSELTTGTDNTMVGPKSGQLMTTDSDNTIIGNFSGNQGGLDIRTSSGHIVLSDGDGNPRGIFDSSGNLLVGCTALPSAGTGGAGFEANQSGDRTILQLGTTVTTAEGVARFYNPNGAVGSISLSGSATAFNTSSDHRLKENVVSMTGATARLKQLAPKRFNFIADTDTTVDGFLAHEVSSVVPEAITGTHNEVDDDGNAVYQGIDQSKLVPLLVATIQELEARIAALESN